MLGCVVMPKGEINYIEGDELQLFSEFLHFRHCFSIELLRDCLCFALSSTYMVCGRVEPTGHMCMERGEFKHWDWEAVPCTSTWQGEKT